MNAELLQYINRLSLADKKDLVGKTLKTTEEVGDLAKVVLSYSNAYATTHRFVAREKILEEAADALLCVLSVVYSEGFTDDELTAMVQRKADKWAMIQAKESGVTYPLPYEIHLTIPYDAMESDHAALQQLCTQLNVKLISLELNSISSDGVLQDVMTSSVHHGDNKSAYLYAQSVKSSIEAAGFDVTRVKIETVPWHPAVPTPGEPFDDGCYLEAHIPVILSDLSQYPALKKDIEALEDKHLHLSRNRMKKTKDGSTTTCVMITYRRNDVYRDEFASLLKQYVEQLSLTWTVLPHHTEYAIFDTNVAHDQSWISSSYATSTKVDAKAIRSTSPNVPALP